MGMSVGSGGSDEPMMDINTTPLIDVMLVLIITLIMSIPVMTHAVKLDMPQPSNSVPPTPPTVVNLVIDFDGKVYWDGEPVDLPTLESRFRGVANIEPQPELHIRPDKWAKYDAVAQVLAAAQRNRMEKIGMVGAEQFMD
jgi:biopolymer transport protein ExbD